MPTDVRLVWNGEKISAQIHSAIDRRLDSAAIHLVNVAKQSLSTHYPPASQPGYPPHKRSNRLRGSVTWAPNGRFVRRVGTNVWYGKRLEEGDSGVEARPWLRPAFMAERLKMERIIGAPIL
jgi:hypothetical protein